MVNDVSTKTARDLLRGGHVFADLPPQLTHGSIMKDSIVSGAYVIGFFLLVGLMFDGCLIANAISDVARAIRH